MRLSVLLRPRGVCCCLGVAAPTTALRAVVVVAQRAMDEEVPEFPGWR